MKKVIAEAFSGHSQAVAFLSKHTVEIERIAVVLIKTLKSKGKILVAGNGGSASDAQHFVAELVGRFKKNRAPLAAIALSTNTSIITAVGNDFGFDEIFSYQLKALGKPKDVLFVLSTSGNSKNIIKAVKDAHLRKITTVALLGKDGGKLKAMADIQITIPFDTPRTQEMHGLIIHILSELIENEFCFYTS